MNFLNRVSNALSRSLVDAGRTRARLELLKGDDRRLADNGFSRELLERGNDAWPWRVDGAVPSRAPRFALPPAGLRTPVPATLLASGSAQAAEAGLCAMSDADLSDLGIDRANIAAAVRDGRPGVDELAGGAGGRKAA